MQIQINLIDKSNEPIIQNVFDLNADIPTGQISQAEVNKSVKLRKNGKAPGLDGLPSEFWKLPKIRKQLL